VGGVSGGWGCCGRIFGCGWVFLRIVFWVLAVLCDSGRGGEVGEGGGEA
jgi:hypothetical protein